MKEIKLTVERLMPTEEQSQRTMKIVDKIGSRSKVENKLGKSMIS